VTPDASGGSSSVGQGGAAEAPADPEDDADAEEVCIPLSLKCEATPGPTPGYFAAMMGAMALIVASLGRRWRRSKR
jgi:hypothetical protein